MFINKWRCSILIYCFFNTTHASDVNGTVVFEPGLTRINSLDQTISLKCSLTTNQALNQSLGIGFAVNYLGTKNRTILEMADCHNSYYCDKNFTHTYKEWKENFDISEDSFPLKCRAIIPNSNEDQINLFGYATIEYDQGKNHGEICNSIYPCKINSHLICNTTCKCEVNYTPIKIEGSFDHQCFPSVNHNESCLYNQQCQSVDPNTLCRFSSIPYIENKTCLCMDYYKYNGSVCLYHSYWPIWCRRDYMYNHWIDITILLGSFLFGLCFLLIVIKISLHLRSKSRRNGNNSEFIYPSSLSPKCVISKYFCHNKKEDKAVLTENDFNSNNQIN